MITPKSAFGTALKIGNGASTEVFSLIEGIRNLQGPALDMEMIDSTHHASAGGFRNKIPSFKDGGTVTFDLLFDGTDDYHQQLFEEWADQTLVNFVQEQTDAGGQTFEYSAYVKSIQPSAPIDDVLAYAVTLEVDGPVAVDYTP